MSSAAPARSEVALAALREALQRTRSLVPRKAPSAEGEAMAATGLAALDGLLGGGLPRGRVTELVGTRSSGRTALCMAALAAATRRGEVTALVDVAGVLDARRAEAAGIELARLLWVRAGDAKRGVQATDVVLGAGGFGVVVLDLGDRLPRVPDNSWLRLSRAAEKSGATLIVLAPPLPASSASRASGGAAARERVLPLFAALRLHTSCPGRPRFADGRVLVSIESRVEVRGSKRGPDGETATLSLRLRG